VIERCRTGDLPAVQLEGRWFIHESVAQSYKLRPRKYGASTELFWSRVDKDGPNGCWLWTGVHIGAGYGQASLNGVRQVAHRVAYELTVGPVPEGLQLDHLCRNRGCVNPDHLEPVTASENKRRAWQASLQSASDRDTVGA
jgi:hypothetical protein